eukprot:scaffold11806_cov52-Phaeocystis_antarctica.AAC.1
MYGKLISGGGREGVERTDEHRALGERERQGCRRGTGNRHTQIPLHTDSRAVPGVALLQDSSVAGHSEKCAAESQTWKVVSRGQTLVQTLEFESGSNRMFEVKSLDIDGGSKHRQTDRQ